MALNSIHPQDEYYEQAVKWGESHNWMLNSYKVGQPKVHSRNANDHCAGQTYLELYQIDPKPERIATIRGSLDSIVKVQEANKDWHWVDALFMAMPTFAKLGVIDKDEKYFDKAHEMYLEIKNEIGGGLYNSEDGLWWRDADFVAPYKEPNGEDCYWSRGNGWVYAALVRVLDVLPRDNKYREEYLKIYKEMSEALLKIQRSDGFWNVSLHDSTHFGGKELTGTAMFTYGLAWGINNKVLDESEYSDAMLKAWKGLSECVHKDGYLGYVQGTGKEPKDSQPVSYDSEPDLQDYGLGCFLLGGSEVYKYLLGSK
jgi:unsaturated rhamnogalacturonyl hydrolase